jgi:hypothetical protein
MGEEKNIGLFELTAMEMTRKDAGGAAGEQLSIAEARQGLRSALRVMADQLTLRQVAELIADYAISEIRMPRRQAE